MQRHTDSRNKDSIQISLRIDKETDNMLCKIMQETGQTKSQVIKKRLKENNGNIEIKNGTKIAEGLFNIQLLLKQLKDDDSVKVKIESTCDCVIQELYKLFNKGGNFDGNSESDKC